MLEAEEEQEQVGRPVRLPHQFPVRSGSWSADADAPEVSRSKPCSGFGSFFRHGSPPALPAVLGFLDAIYAIG